MVTILDQSVDVGFLSWPKLSISVQMTISSLLLLPLADGHIQPGGEERRSKHERFQPAEKKKAMAQDKGEEETGNRTWVAE